MAITLTDLLDEKQVMLGLRSRKAPNALREIIALLAQNGKVDPLQQAFIDHDGPQCGFCTSGQLMSAKALVLHNPHPTRDEVRAGMTGNLCRCSNYNHYVEAVLAATAKSATSGGGGNA